MFVERFDGLMNIAELSNSQLGREISMNPSRIGRLRSGCTASARSTTSFCPDGALIWRAPTLRE